MEPRTLIRVVDIYTKCRESVTKRILCASHVANALLQDTAMAKP